MKELLFATHNQNKVGEIQEVVGSDFRIISLDDLGYDQPIPENEPTIEANAMHKARYIFDALQRDCFADDTGLEVEALKGEPGVYSARYAELTNEVFPNEDIPAANIRKLLKLMHGIKNRNACFRTVIAVVMDNVEYSFEGRVSGEILNYKRGYGGFGYDPVFLPDGYEHTFAEMSLHEKNKISHRAQAMNELIKFLHENNR
jgi:XTP/dITP diphosphohydrolase